MFLIERVTNSPKQKRTLNLPDGSQVTFEMFYSSQQRGWFVSELIYGDFVLRGLRICNSPNLLLQWMNIIPFGLSCLSGELKDHSSMREPELIDDFVSGFSNLYVLDREECISFLEFLKSG